MNATKHPVLLPSCAIVVWLLVTVGPLSGQTLLNIDFGVGTGNVKTGFAATGLHTNDYWNSYGHYEPKFVPGMALVPNGKLDKLKFADGTASGASVSVANAPGVWGNSSGDPMYDTYMFAQNGSNIVVTLRGLPAGRYHFYMYGHADPDVTGEQNSVFMLKSGTNALGPVPQLGSNGWKASGNWQERAQYVVFRDVAVDEAPVLRHLLHGQWSSLSLGVVVLILAVSIVWSLMRPKKTKLPAPERDSGMLKIGTVAGSARRSD